MFQKLNESPEFKYFYSRLKDVFMKNITYYNERETVYAIEGLLRLKCEFSDFEIDLIKQKIISLNNFLPHDTVKLMKVLISNNYGFPDVIEKLIASINIEKLTYGDLIEFVDILANSLPNQFITFTTHLSHYEKRVELLLTKIYIDDFCKIFNLTNRVRYSNTFYDNLVNIFRLRINEIPKEHFAEILTTVTNHRMTDSIFTLIDILEDLSNFENLDQVFESPKDKLNLLWSMLSIHTVIGKGNQKQKEFVIKFIDKWVEFTDNQMKISAFNANDFIYKTNGIIVRGFEINMIKYLQTVYLSAYYLKDIHQCDISIFERVSEDVDLSGIEHNCRFNLIDMDAASQGNKEVIMEIENEILDFFKLKVNTSIYPNFIDDVFNPINIVIIFEKPSLEPGQKIVGIDAKKYAIVVINEKYNNQKGELLTIYENRLNLLKNLFEWELITISEDEWIKASDKYTLLKKVFGFSFESKEDTVIKFEEEESKPTTGPKYNLAKNIIKKKK
jgi:hypothetical protein